MIVETSEEFSGEALEGEVADDGYVENDGDSEAADEIGSAEEAGVSNENKENEGTGEDIEAEESDEADELGENDEDGETDELGGLKDSEKDVDEEAELQAGSTFFKVVDGTLTLIEGQESNFNGATECVIPDDCEEIPANIFVNKRNLAKITFNDSSKLNDIAFGAFEGCGVKTLIIPKGVTTVGDSTFKGCKSLTNITFRGTLTEIGDYAFAECESLTVVNDISSVTSIGSYAFDNCGVFKNANLESAKTIGAYAFRNCYKLMSLNLSKDLESIGISAFKATGISSLTIPDMNSEVVSLGDGIFESCPNLTSVTWPGCITTEEGKVLDTKTKYRYQLVCHLENDDKTPYYSPVYTVTPKQTFPKVKAVASATSVYAGQNRDRIIKVDLSTSGVTNCKMTDVTFASNTPQNIKDAFEINFNQETMQVTLRLKNASKVVANKKNTITLVTQYENQMSNSTGTSFKVDVTVKK